MTLKLDSDYNGGTCKEFDRFKCVGHIDCPGFYCSLDYYIIKDDDERKKKSYFKSNPLVESEFDLTYDEVMERRDFVHCQKTGFYVYELNLNEL